MKPALATDHDISAGCSKLPRHSHHWSPKPDLVQRCRCGARAWDLDIGGGLPPAVACALCGTQNKTNTAYERGIADAHLRG